MRRLTDNEKFYLLKHHYASSKGYQFPARAFGAKQRRFQVSWLDKFGGLVYSESKEGGYCKYCVLFATCEGSVKGLGVLVNQPLTYFKKATEILLDHFHAKGRKSYLAALERAMAFLAVMENRTLSIDQQLSSRRAQLVASNRQKIAINCCNCNFCGRQGITLRGHRDDGVDVFDDNPGRHGNFQALIRFRIEAGDKVLEEHLKQAGGRAVYTSKESQNEFLVACGFVIQQKIVAKIQVMKNSFLSAYDLFMETQ